jgi:CBS domain-containing protein
MAKTVRDAMTLHPKCASSSMSVAEAARTLASEDVGSLPVVDGARLVGMVTDRDIVTRVVAQRKDPESTTVAEIASSEPVFTDPRDDLDEALELMARHQIRRLPVVEDEILVGILAQADVAREAREKQTGELVEEISQPGGRTQGAA